MAVNEQTIAAAPEDVFAILRNGALYLRWVVGSKRIRAVDEGWPAVGSAFHHTVGIGPLTIDDSSSVLEIEPPRRIRLEVRTRPLLVATVTLQLEPVGEGTRVTMHEEIGGGALAPVRRLLDPLIVLRNAESLRRLRRLAEGSAEPAFRGRRSGQGGR